MDTGLKLTSIKARSGEPDAPGRRAPALAVSALALGLAGWTTSLAAGRADGYWQAAMVALWSGAGAWLAVRRPGEPLGLLVAWASVLAGLESVAAALLSGAGASHAIREAAEVARPLAAALMPVAGLHLVLGLPDGRLSRRASRVLVAVAYPAGIALGAGLWTLRPRLPLWPLAVESALVASIALAGSAARYRRSKPLDRQRMQWFGLGVTAAAGVSLVAAALGVLLGWGRYADVVRGASVLVPLALVPGGSTRLIGRVDRLLTHTVSAAGLSAVVVGVYLTIVIGLGRLPRREERVLLLLSMVAAAVSALLYLPTRERLSRFATRVVYGERHAPDEAIRSFSSRLTRAVPLDELLLQAAESLRKTLVLAAAEVWTGSGGTLERAASSPERGPAALPLAPSEEPVVARAGVSGRGWMQVWLPQLLAGREEAHLRVAPATHAGELLGLIVAERPPGGEPFGPDDDQVLGELARQVGLALHNVRLDSALQASLDEVRRQAEELRASRARIVATADAERRRIERNLHDGAQQHLVALAVKVRLIKQLAEAKPEQAKQMLEELGGDIQTTLEELRTLAHGIYPPLLMDRGLAEALSAAATRAALPVEVRADGVGRFRPEVEAAVYFCCLEALQNAGKHAGEGAKAIVRVWEEAGGLILEVADDGVGFDASARGLGAGFTNMSDRLGAIGGSLRVESAPGAGTRVSGAIPLPR